jgi:penicillin-binding protein 2
MFIAFSIGLLFVCVLRLVQMQLLAGSAIQDEIAALKRQRGLSRQLKTLRGRILDRNGNVLAVDTPQFQINISYALTSVQDDRIVRAMRLKAQADGANTSLVEVIEEIDRRQEDIQHVIETCTQFGPSRLELQARVEAINDEVWDLRAFLAWYRSGPDPNLLAKYEGRINSIPQSEAVTDFARRFPDPAQRAEKILAVNDIPELTQSRWLLDLETDDAIFAAQVEFMDANDVQIVPKNRRDYPYGSVACHTIGWLGSATQDHLRQLFEHDRLASYTRDDTYGMPPGVEYVFESVLRGRRGEMAWDIDRQLVDQTETQFGRDVTLTLDIALQQRIEAYLTDSRLNPYYDANMAAVVIDVGSTDVLSMVSLPGYDLNSTRYDYGRLINDDVNTPLINRVLNKHYPPGSSVKPIILVAAMEAGKVAPDEIIHCPAQAAPPGWPNCLIWRTSRACHDWQWDNNARNAIKGSCNIYFSRAAARLDPSVLQEWMFDFGYGRPVALEGSISREELGNRRLRQGPGQISSTPPSRGTTIETVENLPPLLKKDLPLYGIGQGNLWTTPIQVANAFATIAREGLYKPPRLVASSDRPSGGPGTNLNISQYTLAVVYDGMYAVVNEPGGTAYRAFSPAALSQYDVRVYGKTGSTQDPEHAWFGGFAQDSSGRKVVVAIVVEGGQHGSSDAAPLARDIIQFCIEADYVGENPSGLPIEAIDAQITRN